MGRRLQVAFLAVIAALAVGVMVAEAQRRGRGFGAYLRTPTTYFYTFSVEGYAFGIDVLLYSMAD